MTQAADSILISSLSPRARRALTRIANADQILGADLQSKITTFRRLRQDTDGLHEESPAEKSETEALRTRILAAIDRFEDSVKGVVLQRETEERQARRWVSIGGIVLVILVLGSAASALFSDGAANSWIISLMSGITVSGLVFILYSPVQKLIEIASDRSSLLLLPSTYRLRVLSAASAVELSAIARDLSAIVHNRVGTTSDVPKDN